MSFDRSLEDLASDRTEEGADRLLDVWHRCGTSPLGERALLLFAGEKLAPTGTDTPREPAAAAAAAARLIRTPGRSSWADAVARVLYLAAHELSGSGGGPDFSIPVPVAHPESCDLQGTSLAREGELPELPERPLADRLRALQGRSDSLQLEVERLKELLGGSGGWP